MNLRNQRTHGYLFNSINTYTVTKIGDRIGSDLIFDQLLMFGGKQLSDDKKMIDYNVHKHLTLFLSGHIVRGAIKVEIHGRTLRGK